MLCVSQSADEDSGKVLAFLQSLISEYGVDGLRERFRAAIEEAEAGRVAGPGIQEATAWLESVHGEQVRSFTGAAMLTATAPSLRVGSSGKLRRLSTWLCTTSQPQPTPL